MDYNRSIVAALSKMHVLHIFVAKNYLWPETGTGGGLNWPPTRGWICKTQGG